MTENTTETKTDEKQSKMSENKLKSYDDRLPKAKSYEIYLVGFLLSLALTVDWPFILVLAVLLGVSFIAEPQEEEEKES